MIGGHLFRVCFMIMNQVALNSNYRPFYDISKGIDQIKRKFVDDRVLTTWMQNVVLHGFWIHLKTVLQGAGIPQQEVDKVVQDFSHMFALAYSGGPQLVDYKLLTYQNRAQSPFRSDLLHIKSYRQQLLEHRDIYQLFLSIFREQINHCLAEIQRNIRTKTPTEAFAGHFEAPPNYTGIPISARNLVLSYKFGDREVARLPYKRLRVIAGQFDSTYAKDLHLQFQYGARDFAPEEITV